MRTTDTATGRHPRLGYSVWLLILCAFSPLFSTPLADDADSRRLSIGLKLFPAILAADQNLAQKTGDDGRLLLLVVHSGDTQSADRVADALQQVGAIRNLSLRTRTIEAGRLQQLSGTTVAGLFVAHPLFTGTDRIIQFAIDNGIVSFSPFEGDVERGILGGISVSDRILPYINARSLNDSGVDLKPFFLRITDVYQ